MIYLGDRQLEFPFTTWSEDNMYDTLLQIVLACTVLFQPEGPEGLVVWHVRFLIQDLRE